VGQQRVWDVPAAGDANQLRQAVSRNFRLDSITPMLHILCLGAGLSSLKVSGQQAPAIAGWTGATREIYTRKRISAAILLSGRTAIGDFGRHTTDWISTWRPKRQQRLIRIKALGAR